MSDEWATGAATDDADVTTDDKELDTATDGGEVVDPEAEVEGDEIEEGTEESIEE